MSLADTAGGGLWNAFLGGRQQAQQEGTANLQNVGALQAVLARAKQDQLANAFRDEMSRASTPDEQASVAVKYGDPTHVLANATRVAGVRATQEMARARLTQALQLADMTHQDRLSKMSDAREIAAEHARHNGIVEAIQRDALANAGARLAYDTGATPANSSAAVPPPAGASAPQQGITVQGSFPEADANIVGASPSLLAAAAQKDPTIAAVLSRAGVTGLPQAQPSAAPEAAASTPAPVSVPQPDAGNLDARDLMARGASAAPQAIPNAAPSPLPTAPVAAVNPVEAAIEKMPPEIARLPKKQQDAWVVANSGGGIENTAKGIANYEIAPLSSFAMARPLGAQIMGKVKEYNPNFDAKQFPIRQAAEKAFTSGRQGDQVRSFNVAINHLGTLKDLTVALQNGDIKQINRAAQAFAEQTGETPPTNFDAAKKIVGDEISKAIIGAKGSLGDREATAASISRMNAPQQLSGVIDTYLKLMGGQLSGLRQQYESGTMKKDFNERFLTKEGLNAVKGGIPEFATEADAVKAGAKGHVKIGGVVGTLN